MTQIVEIDTQTLSDWLEEGSALVIDVREAPELAEMSLDGAIHVPMSDFKPEAVPTDSGKKLVFVCAQGMRSFQVGQYMLNQGLVDEAFNLSEGLSAWVQAGKPFKRG